MPAADPPRVPFVRALVPAWLVTAVWDAACASALSAFAYGVAPGDLWRGVAATALGAAPLARGASGVAAGLALHLAVALAWSALLVAAVRAWPALARAIRTPGGALAVAAVYGPAIWLVMSVAVIPLATGQPPRIGVRWWVQVVAHVPFVAIPLVFMTRRVLAPRPRPDA